MELIKTPLLLALLAAPCRAEGPDRREELTAKAMQLDSRLSALLADVNGGSAGELRKKLDALREARTALGEENALRFQITEEAAKLQYGIRALAAGGPDAAGILGKIDRILAEASVASRDTEAAGEELAKLRSAIAAFRAGNGGSVPKDPAELSGAPLPYIRMPGHTAGTNSVRVLKGIRSAEDAFQKVDDAGGWLYVGDKTSPVKGLLFFNCNHKSHEGKAMYRY